MSQVDAIFQDGVFKPLREVVLPANQRVRLDIHPVEIGDAQEWIERVRRRRTKFAAERGYLPDSAIDIAEDRKR